MSSSSLTLFARKAGKGYGTFPEAYLARLGVMFSCKQVANELKAKHNLDVIKILFRADAHPWTYNTGLNAIKPDLWHLTLDVKDKEMDTKSQHLTVHAYVGLDEHGTIINMFNIDSIVPKLKKGSTTELAVEPDSYIDYRKGGKPVNNWDPASLEFFPEPAELKKVVLGKGFITVAEYALSLIPKEKQEAEIEAATVEEANIRKSLAVIPKE
ncbi:hypothetical protein CPC08DRAFT_708799 [Agrocybe pediades]|nr:hypothetical protein CPC08DRAFT_708799 [Agrocybe pediades]